MEVTMALVLGQLNRTEPDYEQAAQLGPEALPFLTHLVEGGCARLASRATYLAGLISGARSLEVVQKAARSPHPVVRVAAAASLSNLEEIPSPLAESMLTDEDVGVRKWALRSLEDQKPMGFKSRVREIAENDPNITLRETASRVAKRLP